jgi:hypothetical protein
VIIPARRQLSCAVCLFAVKVVQPATSTPGNARALIRFIRRSRSPPSRSTRSVTLGEGLIAAALPGSTILARARRLRGAYPCSWRRVSRARGSRHPSCVCAPAVARPDVRRRRDERGLAGHRHAVGQGAPCLAGAGRGVVGDQRAGVPADGRHDAQPGLDGLPLQLRAGPRCLEGLQYAQGVLGARGVNPGALAGAGRTRTATALPGVPPPAARHAARPPVPGSRRATSRFIRICGYRTAPSRVRRCDCS